MGVVDPPSAAPPVSIASHSSRTRAYGVVTRATAVHGLVIDSLLMKVCRGFAERSWH